MKRTQYIRDEQGFGVRCWAGESDVWVETDLDGTGLGFLIQLNKKQAEELIRQIMESSGEL